MNTEIGELDTVFGWQETSTIWTVTPLDVGCIDIDGFGTLDNIMLN